MCRRWRIFPAGSASLLPSYSSSAQGQGSLVGGGFGHSGAAQGFRGGRETCPPPDTHWERSSSPANHNSEPCPESHSGPSSWSLPETLIGPAEALRF